MLVSELADAADVPLATVKYYLREGLLPAGETTGPRRAEYAETHVRRLRVLRLLREVGGVPVTSLRQVIDALEDEDLPVHEVMTVIADVIADAPEVDFQEPASLDLVDEVVAGVGWDHIRPESVDRQRLASLVSLLNAPGPLNANRDILTFYATAADQIARTEVDMLDSSVERSQLLEQLVTGSVVYGQVFGLLRQLAEQHHLIRVSTRPGTDTDTDTDTGT